MTLTLVMPAAEKRPTAFTTTWTAVESGLWSASAPGEFVGTVERLGDGRYRAVDGRGMELGICATLAAAKARVMHPAARGVRGHETGAGIPTT